ncbi:hypothetical protein [Pseudoduganella sp. R-34]|uniref:hypothetical protein n=1 Tax=Pseudoduganella sp. R-34 TaxID=3404062 RepID=UPI003CF33447
MNMAVCLRTVQQSDGTLLLALDPSVTNTATCAYVAESGASNAWQELGNMSIRDAEVISLNIGWVWAVAWGWKAISRAISLNVEDKE